jgi:hypothetical protein
VSNIFWYILSFVVGHSQTIITACAIVGAIAAAATKTIPLVRRLLARRPLQPLIRQEKYQPQIVKQATLNYIEPGCQSLDPSGLEDFRKVIAPRQAAFSTLDEILDAESDEKFTIVLADTGMGKTSLLLNYYSRHARRRKQEFKIALVPLGQPRVTEQIQELRDQEQTAIFLDAFDEDTQAIKDHRGRLGDLLGIAGEFRNVVLTCRTQFFPRDDEIPRETGLLRTGVTRSGQDKEYTFRKLYLAPFSDRQVKQFIEGAYPFWNWRRRRKARQVISQIPDLTARPMLLAHVGDIIDSGKVLLTSAAVYGEMVSSWLARERHFVDPKVLLEFSEVLAADVYLNRAERGGEKLPRAEAEALAKGLGFNIAGWQIAGRSLLNRDREGNLKFAHRSFMEYLFISYFLKCPENVGRRLWTDQMKIFWWETKFLAPEVLGGYAHVPWDWAQLNADIAGLDRLHLRPVISLR